MPLGAGREAEHGAVKSFVQTLLSKLGKKSKSRLGAGQLRSAEAATLTALPSTFSALPPSPPQPSPPAPLSEPAAPLASITTVAEVAAPNQDSIQGSSCEALQRQVLPPHKLLAALDSQPDARGSNTADMTGLLFAQRTTTQSGTALSTPGITMPARLAEGLASAIDSSALDASPPGSVRPGADSAAVPECVVMQETSSKLVTQPQHAQQQSLPQQPAAQQQSQAEAQQQPHQQHPHQEHQHDQDQPPPQPPSQVQQPHVQPVGAPSPMNGGQPPPAPPPAQVQAPAIAGAAPIDVMQDAAAAQPATRARWNATLASPGADAPRPAASTVVVPPPAPTTSTAAPSGVHGEQPLPLSRPMKLTTACLGAHTTLCDSATDHSFQRLLQRKIQMVNKWLQSADLAVPPDPRLEEEAPASAGGAAPLLAAAGPQHNGDKTARAGARAADEVSAPQPTATDAARQAATMEVAARAGSASQDRKEAALPGIPEPSQANGIGSPGKAKASTPHGGAQRAGSSHALRPVGGQLPQSAQRVQAGAGGDAKLPPAMASGGAAAAPTSRDVGGVQPPAAAATAAAQATAAEAAGETAGGPARHQAPQLQGTLRVLQGGEAAAVPAAVRSSSQQEAQLLQHSLSDLYGSGQAPLGTNLPPRVLASSDEAARIAAQRPPADAGTDAGGVAPGVLGTVDAAVRGGISPSLGPSRDAHAVRHSSSSAPARTKTIAVASHCPPELQPQQSSWTIDDFTLLKKLYEGSLSVVCQAQHKRSGRHVALKIYKRSRLHEMERFQLAREICLHIRIVHPYVVALYAAWKDSKYVYLALEWAPQGNMFDFLVSRGGRLDEEAAVRIVVKPLMSALAFLHSQCFIHRDIKLENLLLDASCNLKLADFGLAIDQKFEQANTRLGTFGYFAPEVLNCPLKKGPFDMKDASVPGYDSRVDVWSAGVVGYEVLTGRAPFSASSPAKIIQAIRTRVLEFPGISDEGKEFLQMALTRDPAARPTAKQLLCHPWIVRHSGSAAALNESTKQVAGASTGADGAE